MQCVECVFDDDIVINITNQNQDILDSAHYNFTMFIIYVLLFMPFIILFFRSFS